MPAANAKPFFRVRRSTIHGRGVFAARTIRKGARIVEYKGDVTTWSIARERPDSDPDNPHHTFIFERSDGKVIDAGRGGNAARWINHSCEPNCETVEDDDGRVFIEARRTIRAGEELTYDYQLTVDGRLGRKSREAYACRCGTRRCRGTMIARTPRGKRG
jgi:SET domain-containing protein